MLQREIHGSCGRSIHGLHEWRGGPARLGVRECSCVEEFHEDTIYGIPGLRAGFLYTGSRRLARLADSFRQPWNVNSLAIEVVVRRFLILEKQALRILHLLTS